MGKKNVVVITRKGRKGCAGLFIYDAEIIIVRVCRVNHLGFGFSFRCAVGHSLRDLASIKTCCPSGNLLSNLKTKP
jgi:hypothetical protein